MEDAEDVLQDVLMRLWVNFDDIKSLDKASAWLFRVARNRVTDWYRSRSTSPRALDQKINGDDYFLLEELLPNTADTPENRYAQKEMGLAIDDALTTLPPKQRDVFVWHEIEGRSFAEIADHTGIAINTLLSQKRYAVLELRSILSDFETEIYSQRS